MSVKDTIKKCLTVAVEILKKNFISVLLIVLLVSLPLWAVDFFCVETVCNPNKIAEEINDFTEEYYEKAENGESTEDMELPAEIQSDMQKLMLYYLLEMVLSLLQMLQVCAVVLLAEKKKNNPEARVNTMEIMEEAAIVFPKVMLRELIIAVSVALGCMMFVIPGIIIYAVNCFTVAATVLRKSGRKGRLDSLLVFRKNPGASILTILIYVGIPFAVSYILAVGTSLLSDWNVASAVASAISYIADGVLVCAGYIFCTVFYLEKTEMPFDEEKTENQ